jgi:hypothetical protein
MSVLATVRKASLLLLECADLIEIEIEIESANGVVLMGRVFQVST